MRFMKAIVVLGICFVALGFFRGWFTLSSHGRDAQSNKVDVNLSVDPDKMKEDVGRVNKKSTELGDRAKDAVKSDAEQEEAIKRIDKSHTATTARA